MMAAISALPGGTSHGKLTKHRVKPILKKLGSHSEKTSLDLDRSWDEQRPMEGNGIWNNGWSGTTDSWGSGGGTGTGTGARTARDVTFSLGHGSHGGQSGHGPERKYTHHTRSTSGTSIATTGSGTRGGTFVHPFQQMPRTSTPPLLSYANSLASFDNQRDYSPTITEGDDDGLDGLSSNYPYPSSAAVPTSSLHSRSQSNLRRPSLVSRTSSLSDITAPPPARISTTTTAVPSVSRASTKSRLLSGLSSSRSDLNLNLTLASAKSLPAATLLDSPSAAVTPVSTSGAPISSPVLATASAPASGIASPTGSNAPMSPIRSSLEAAGFPRLRAYSEVSSATHMDMVRNERRKFEEKEYRKQERWDQKMVRKRDRDLNREAAKKEAEEAARARKNSFGSNQRLNQSSKSKSERNLPGPLTQIKKKKIHNSDSAIDRSPVSADSEKSASFPTFQRNYSGTAQAPDVPTVEEDPMFTHPPKRRTNTAKEKTVGAWTSLILWLRTKLFRLSRSS